MIESRRETTTPFDELDRAEVARRYGRAAAYREEVEESTAFWLRLAALFFIVALLVLFTSYTLAEVTSRQSAERIIGRAIPEITDFDHAFAGHYDDLLSAAASPANASGVTLSSYPVRVALPPGEVLRDSPEELRHLLLIRSADAVYNSGINAFSPDGRPVKLGSSGFLSGPWAFKTALSILNPDVHKELRRSACIAAIVSVVLALLLVVLGRQYNRIVMYGVAAFVAAVPGLATSVLIWLLVQVVFGSSSDPLVAGTSDITRDVAWYVILSYLVFAALGAALFILGMIMERIGLLVATPRDPARNREYRARV